MTLVFVDEMLNRNGVINFIELIIQVKSKYLREIIPEDLTTVTSEKYEIRESMIFSSFEELKDEILRLSPLFLTIDFSEYEFL